MACCGAASGAEHTGAARVTTVKLVWALLGDCSTIRVEKEVHSGGTLLALTCRMGMAKAPVLPEPVCARPMTSLPTANSNIGSGFPSVIHSSGGDAM